MNDADLHQKLAPALAQAATLERLRGEIEDRLVALGRIAGLNGMDAAMAGLVLRAKRTLLGPPPGS